MTESLAVSGITLSGQTHIQHLHSPIMRARESLIAGIGG